jgi:hypothetical protein
VRLLAPLHPAILGHVQRDPLSGLKSPSLIGMARGWMEKGSEHLQTSEKLTQTVGPKPGEEHASLRSPCGI